MSAIHQSGASPIEPLGASQRDGAGRNAATRRATATAVGLVAVLLWSSLALLTKEAGAIPPFQLLAMSFSVAFLGSVCFMSLRGSGAFRAWRQPFAVWASGFAGIFVYHALYFYALATAPAAAASLIAYLWPLLIVLLSMMAERGAFRVRHLAGTLAGFAGTALLVLGSVQVRNGGSAMPGYAAAFGCALTWAVYSVGNRRFRQVSSDVIGGICGLVAIAALGCHLLFETTVPLHGAHWIPVVLLGLGPTGLAFFAWDHATKHGSIGLLGALSYMAPLMSTFILVTSGFAAATWSVLIASLLIVSGAAIASFQI